MQESPSPSPKPKPKQVQKAGFDSTLRLPKQEIDALRQMLDGGAEGISDAGSIKRHYRRWAMDTCAVHIRMTHPGGMATALDYTARNISGGGMSILHTSFVHNGTRCLIVMQSKARGRVEIGGSVIRCRHCKGKVHEVGIKFDQTIDVREFLEIESSETALILEHVKPESVSGTLLLVEDSELDRVLIRKCLAETNLDVVPVSTGADALARAKEGFDLILSELDLPDMSAFELLAKVRAMNIHTPMIVLCADQDIRLGASPNGPVPDGTIPKPFKPDRLLGGLAEFLLCKSAGGSGGSMIHSTLGAGDTARSLVPNFIEEVKKVMAQLEAAIAKGDAAQCKRIAGQLRGSAPMFGFDPVAKAAHDAYSSIATSGSVGESLAQLNALMVMCSRVRPLRDAA